MNLKSTPHSVKLWQLHGTDYEPQRPPKLKAETRFSSWTPLNDKQRNLQLFEERVNLVLHWFDLWTDTQRKHLLHSLLSRGSKSQLKYCRDLLIETVPVTHADFTAILPRFLSLYVMSFLSPRELCSAAQVSWHWRILSEQDCLWADRCIRRGWFLPYTPGEKEYGAWKNHYVSCVSWLTPREASKPYGTLNQQSPGLMEEEEERSEERRIRQKIRDVLQVEKRLSMSSRRPWGYAKPDGSRGGSMHAGRSSSGLTSSSWPSLCWQSKAAQSSSICFSVDKKQTVEGAQSLERVKTSRVNRTAAAHTTSNCSPAALLLLVSNRIPAYELVLSGVKAGVIVVLYDYRETLPTLLMEVERTVSGLPVQRVGLLAPGGTEEIHLLHDCSLSERTLLTHDHREFWEKLCAWVTPTQQGGGIDIFCPLAASASGVTLLQSLSALTDLQVRAPAGLVTGSFQNILSEWSGGDDGAALLDQHPTAPALQYMSDGVLQAWCRQAQWMEEALQELRRTLEVQLQQSSLQARGRALGHFLWEKLCLDKMCVSRELSEALTEGLTALTEQEETRPLEFLSSFLLQWSEEENEEDSSLVKKDSLPNTSLLLEQPQMALDWRGLVARELHHSEGLYLRRLSSILKVYQEPLTAALNSNRAILSYADIEIIFSQVTVIQQLNSVFQADLQTRMQQWAADQCVGDVFLKLCSKLSVYTNYLNNYTLTLGTIDKCREAKPAFRAFLKRADRTLSTHMLSLQELLLCPVWRIQEYVTLLQALSSNTQLDHPDHTHLCTALSTMLRLRHFIQTIRRNFETDRLLEETQQMIQNCPSLREGNRQLIRSQDAVLLRSPDDQIPDSLRTFEQVADVGLFLFNDALVLTRRKVHHTPFTVSHRSTHTFLASVALSSLSVREITHTRYVSHAFVLEGPTRSWVCATDRGEDRENFLSVLRLTISSSLRGHQ
ncbi:epithelial cell-transforming sequence 2 oncogene-like [Nematolebias whitei]|uniref:epithelial cell-transforming sequence 2 oncogene-like n=1 Tax=Nematolebias whitei TaxID=451745 RepID=UPI00189AD6E6|nr:epithelial cell-transforming sequence 2 oncogene-like [Nematolebias whitei]